ncbi:RrF2 family transcriptional regulator [Fusobacterium sp. PH5-44]|uniref:RrF2 family transcriptional regulator n=1 Tax=unclassified Fusobacterium TaxID=2648384 RepID=UPI003D23E984
MKLTNEVEYAFRIMFYLASAPEGKIISSVEISNEEKVPHLFGLRILKKIENAGLVEVFKGAKGGYRLKKDSKKISLKDIIEAIEDKINITAGIAKKGYCSERYEKSGIRKILTGIEKDFLKSLSSVSLFDIADKQSAAKTKKKK